MRTLLIDTDRLGPVMLREAPRRLERDGDPLANARGEPIFPGRLIVPGGARSTYSDQPSPREVRLKTVGSDRGLRPGVVRLAGRVTLTAWYQRGGRGRDATSELTVSAERIEPAQGRVSTSGWLPVRFMTPTPTDAPLVLDQAPLQDGGFRVYVMLPEGSVDGLAEVTSPLSVEHLIGQYAVPELWAKLVVPDREDIGRTSKAELPLMATSWAEAGKVPAPRREAKPDTGEVAA